MPQILALFPIVGGRTIAIGFALLIATLMALIIPDVRKSIYKDSYAHESNEQLIII